MRRRAFLTGLGAVLASPLVAEGQQTGKVYRIGYLSLHPQSDVDEAFRKGLREHGWVEGQNIRIEWRFAEWKRERLPDLAAELVRLQPDLIFATSTPPAQAVKDATTAIPIVFTNVADPVRVGLVKSLGRPGNNITGFTTVNVELSQKRLEILKEAVPGLARVAVFLNPGSPQGPFLLKETETAASVLGIGLRVLRVARVDELADAFNAIKKEQLGALVVLPDPLHNLHETHLALAELAMKHRLPVIAPYRGNAEAGLLMSYGPNLPDLVRRSAVYVDRILKGAKPAELPVEQPTKFELVINLKTAKALGLTIPLSLLLRADQVIE